MMSASEAKKTAETNKNQVDHVDHVLQHFEQLIKKATNQGKFNIEPQTFSEDQFKPSVIDEVTKKLQEFGYKVTLTKSNAYHQITFKISW